MVVSGGKLIAGLRTRHFSGFGVAEGDACAGLAGESLATGVAALTRVDAIGAPLFADCFGSAEQDMTNAAATKDTAGTAMNN